MENLTKCPSCGGEELTDYLNTKDYSITGEPFNLSKCTRCTLIFTNPRPDENEIGKYYESSEYISHSDISKGFINNLYHRVRKITLKGKLNLINSFGKKGEILDIGCGTGYFLSECKENGWRIEGMEPDKNARKMAINNTGSDIYDNISSIKGRNYDVITMWHVLEHVHDIHGTLKTIHNMMDFFGTLIIAVPNCQSYDAKNYKEKWAAYDVPRHLYHFTPHSLKYLLEIHEFKVIDIKPMKFDSFYVSLISEKYKKSGLLGLPKAFITGLISNLKANKNNYSSLIYIIKKDCKC